MKIRYFIAASREEVVRAAPWATVIKPLPELKDGWFACDTQEACDYALANRAKFLPAASEDWQTS
jgi:hypothetical protein